MGGVSGGGAASGGVTGGGAASGGVTGGGAASGGVTCGGAANGGVTGGGAASGGVTGGGAASGGVSRQVDEWPPSPYRPRRTARSSVSPSQGLTDIACHVIIHICRPSFLELIGIL